MDDALAQEISSTEAIAILTQIVPVGLIKNCQTSQDHDLELEFPISHTLALDAEERTRSRLKFAATDGTIFKLELPRGTVLGHGDLLQDDRKQWCVQVAAKPEPVTTVRATDMLTHLKAVYHLGNRHVALEITADYLRFAPDQVLEDMVRQMGLEITAEVAPFQPESGAYHSHRGAKSAQASHSHSNSHSHDHSL
ncbi:MAG: urease accessory protein UreE [Pseudanabaena sp. ELA607]|jgi:urease accessory protein